MGLLLNANNLIPNMNKKFQQIAKMQQNSLFAPWLAGLQLGAGRLVFGSGCLAVMVCLQADSGQMTYHQL
jgi:hypothetical protein